MTFTKQIIIGLVFGLFIGVFLGAFASGFSVAGNVYIALLQMTVLPCIVVSRISNLGRITYSADLISLYRHRIVLRTCIPEYGNGRILYWW
jgi:Na+/H+-dicarboxylate symporter